MHGVFHDPYRNRLPIVAHQSDEDAQSFTLTQRRSLGRKLLLLTSGRGLFAHRRPEGACEGEQNTQMKQLNSILPRVGSQKTARSRTQMRARTKRKPSVPHRLPKSLRSIRGHCRACPNAFLQHYSTASWLKRRLVLLVHAACKCAGRTERRRIRPPRRVWELSAKFLLRSPKK